ncbi:MAG TPA: hypothetical protein VKT53_15280 [Candidatus Acidoferrum sp.]|nr:hypothetical protein [Candidatus Acidoferrum sp.]
MKIQLKQELEELIQRDVQRGPYQSVEEYLERAVTMLHEQESWFAEHGSEIAAKIEVGFAAAQRGELVDAESVRTEMDRRKQAWINEKP